MAPDDDQTTDSGDGGDRPASPETHMERALAVPDPTPEAGELETALELVRAALASYGDDPPYELESRWVGARTLIERGATGAALQLLEEALVLSRVMADLEAQGKSTDLLDQKIEGKLSRRLAELEAGREPAEPAVSPEELERRANEAAMQAFASGLASGPFAGAVLQLIERRLEQQLAEPGFERVVLDLVERRLAAFTGEEPFAAAAAAAAAARPQGLLDRPETRARIEAVALGNDRALLGSANFAERVSGLLRERGGDLLQDGALRGLVEDLTGRRLEVWLDSPELRRRLAPEPPKGQPGGDVSPRRLAELLATPELRAALEARLLELLRTAPGAHRLLEDAALRAGARLAEEARAQAVAESEERLKDALHGPLLEDRLGELARRRAESALEGPNVQRALEARVRRLVEDALGRFEERIDTLLEAKLATRVRAMVDERLSERLARAVADAMDAPLARALEPIRAGLERRVEKQLESSFPALLARALAEGQPTLQKLQEAVDSALKRNVDEERVARMVRKELLNREALQAASMTGEGLLDQATAIGRMVEEKLKELRAQERRPRPGPPGPASRG